MAASNLLNKAMSERALQAAIVEAAQALGWLVHAERPALSKKGWRTPIQGHAGFPDLVLVHVRTKYLCVWELKSERGKPSTAQWVWLETLADMRDRRHVDVRVVRPRDLDHVLELLQKWAK